MSSPACLVFMSNYGCGGLTGLVDPCKECHLVKYSARQHTTAQQTQQSSAASVLVDSPF